jgi:hypothetical protein
MDRMLERFEACCIVSTALGFIEPIEVAAGGPVTKPDLDIEGMADVGCDLPMFHVSASWKKVWDPTSR